MNMDKREMMEYGKRFFLTFLACLPIFILLDILLQKHIGNIWLIIIYAVIAGGAFFLVELIRKKRLARLKKKYETKDEIVNEK